MTMNYDIGSGAGGHACAPTQGGRGRGRVERQLSRARLTRGHRNKPQRSEELHGQRGGLRWVFGLDDALNGGQHQAVPRNHGANLRASNRANRAPIAAHRGLSHHRISALAGDHPRGTSTHWGSGSRPTTACVTFTEDRRAGADESVSRQNGACGFEFCRLSRTRRSAYR